MMSEIYKDLYQFSSYVPAIDLSFHQYLLMGEEPMLIHTGSVQAAEALLPQLKEVLGERKLKYIFVSHFESDECGGLIFLLEHFPDAITLCSMETANQLRGFGIINNAVAKKPGEKIICNDSEFEFIGYPSEVHLWEGLLLMENKRGIFFSSDLVFQFGKASGIVKEGSWQSEVENITAFQVPDKEAKDKLQDNLLKFEPKFVAAGHGPCLKF